MKLRKDTSRKGGVFFDCLHILSCEKLRSVIYCFLKGLLCYYALSVGIDKGELHEKDMDKNDIADAVYGMSVHGFCL